MKYKHCFRKCLVIIFLISVVLSCSSQVKEFKVYHENLPEDFPGVTTYAADLFGKYNDVVVDFGNGEKLIFGKESSFLPVWHVGDQSWRFPELIERKGDGPPIRPDIISRYSYVRVIETNPDTILIHWRYFPDFTKLRRTDVVEEYFTITPGKMVTRTFQKGNAKISEWKDKVGMISHNLELTSDGITLHNEKPQKIPHYFNPNEIVNTPNNRDEQYLLKFSFETINQDATLNEGNGRYYRVNGNETIIKPGIAGQAIELDGYQSGIVARDLLKDDDLKEFTIEAWIALSAYPFEWAPILQQADWGDAGFYFGISKDGNPGIHVMIEDQWKSLVNTERIDLFKWYFLTATYSSPKKSMQLFVNGEKAGSMKLPEEEFVRHSSEVTIGLNRQKMPDITGRMGRGKYPSLIGLEGLIDEVKVSSNVLTEKEIAEIFDQNQINNEEYPKAALTNRTLPKIPTENRFRANYTHLSLYPAWDNLWRVGEYADIVVNFENNPSKLVFWRGTNYGPFFVTENDKWIGDQSNEDYLEDWAPGEAEGCLEHMSDKQNRHAFVRIIGQSDARIIVHWRYASVDSRYLFSSKNGGWGTWTDEYWIIYPDGIAVRHLPHSICFGDGWIENMFLNAPGTKPQDNVEFKAFSVIDPEENKVDYTWEIEPAEGSMDAMVSMVNTKSGNRMFCIYPEESAIEIFSGKNPRYHFHSWNHWPVSQLETDGRSARAEDRITHSSLMHGALEANYLLYGISEKPIEAQIPLARFWRNAPSLIKKKGISNSYYRQEERAYIIEANSNQIEFEIVAEEDTPVINPVFIVKNLNVGMPKIWLNGKEQAPDAVKLGFEETRDGKDLVIFLKREAMTEKIKIRIAQ